MAAAMRRVDPTRKTADTLSGQISVFRHSWRKDNSIRCEVGLPIPPPDKRHLQPKGCDTADAQIQFVFEPGDDIDTTHIPQRAEFRVIVHGRARFGDTPIELQDHWRVDTHLYESAREPREPHPRLHFQRGGRAQNEFAKSSLFVPGDALPAIDGDPWRGLMQTPGPRVPFLPMCPIMAIDYVIGQHDGAVLWRLRGIPEYSGLVRKAQDRLLHPFLEELNRERTRSWLGRIIVA